MAKKFKVQCTITFDWINILHIFFFQFENHCGVLVQNLSSNVAKCDHVKTKFWRQICNVIFPPKYVKFENH